MTLQHKAGILLGRISDPNLRWFRHIATGKIRDAGASNAAIYEAMCRPIGTLATDADGLVIGGQSADQDQSHAGKGRAGRATWEEITAADADKALSEQVVQAARDCVPAAAPMAARAIENLD